MVWGDQLLRRETDYCHELMGQLSDGWARPIVDRCGPRAQWMYETKPTLFELRYAAALARAGVEARYEAPGGLEGTTVDFLFTSSGVNWLVELVAVLTSDAVKKATIGDGMVFGAVLSSDAEDQRQSMAGELILLQQKIGEKVFDGTRPVKFGTPSPGAVHVILVDVRGIGVAGTDCWDYRQALFGAPGMPSPMVHTWRHSSGLRQPMVGLFEKSNTRQRAAGYVRERVHFIGFCWDEEYEDGSLPTNSAYFANPQLLGQTDAREFFRTRYPLTPSDACTKAGAV